MSILYPKVIQDILSPVLLKKASIRSTRANTTSPIEKIAQIFWVSEQELIQK